jgi:hypothetical protein
MDEFPSAPDSPDTTKNRSIVEIANLTGGMMGGLFTSSRASTSPLGYSAPSRNTSAMWHPARVIGQARASYESRFGEDFAQRLARPSWLIVVGAWISIIGLTAVIVGGVVGLFMIASLSAVRSAALVGFAVIVVGFIVGTIGVAARIAGIRALSARIIAFDPAITRRSAKRLIRVPPLYERWMAQHPGFVVS